MAKKLEKAVNVIGSAEVDAYVPKKITGWQKFKKFFTSKHFSKLLWAIFRTVLLVGICFLILYPIILRLSSSLKPFEEAYDPTVMLIPKNPTLDLYITMWDYINAPKLFINSIVSSGLLGATQMVSCMFVAYGLARFKFKGNGAIFGVSIVTLIIPVQIITTAMIFRYKAFNPLTMFSFGQVLYEVPNIDMTKGWTAIIMLSVTATMYRNGLFIFLLRQYFKNQPKELEEAAYIDGAGPFRTFLQVMLPSALPILVTVFLFAFVWQYNDIVYTSLLNPTAQVMATRVANAAGNYIFTVLRETENLVLGDLLSSALMIMHITPIIILYVFCQRFFVQSIERSGMVG